MESANKESNFTVVGNGNGHSSSKPGPKKMVSQEDLAEEEFLRQEAKTATDKLQNKRREIREALEAGAAVEPGIRQVTLHLTKMLTIR